MGTMSAVLDDVTPLQLGTRGFLEGVRFTLIGRLRLTWSDGFWNEWCVLFDDTRIGWLAEAQGFYMMSFETDGSVGAPARDQLRAGLSVNLAGHVYRVDDIKSARCTASEGELPFAAPTGRQNLSVDLSSDDDRFACLDYSDEGMSLYLGHYVELSDLRLSNLRKIDGW